MPLIPKRKRQGSVFMTHEKKLRIKYDAVLFDLDGTLSESAPGIRYSLEETLKKVGADLPNLDDYSVYVGPPLLNTLMNLCSMTKEEADNATEVYREIYNTVGKYKNRLYPGIAELLSILKESDAKIAVATSKYEPFAEDVVKIIGAYEYFDRICGSNLDGSRKDKKDIVEYAKKELNLSDGAKMVLVGDTFYDTKGALSAGIDFIGVNYGYGDKKLMVEWGGKNFADTPMDILKFLTE